MFVLRTGLQGNGKTLNTIKEVDAKAAKEGGSGCAETRTVCLGYAGCLRGADENCHCP